MIAMVYEEPRPEPRVYDERDLPWIAALLDIVEQSCGESWRVLVERVELAPLGAHRAHRVAMLQALRRMVGGGPRARNARRARAMVLGPQAGEPVERRARLVAAAATLGMTTDDVEALLWSELAAERPVVLPEGRPAEAELAALANLARIERWARRSYRVQLRLWDRAHELVRAAARGGLIAQALREGETTVLDVTGPLALCHSTIVYGRAIAAVIPRLAAHERFALELHCRLGGEDVRLRVASPIWLPRAATALPPAATSPALALTAPACAAGAAERLAQALEARSHAIEREPPPIASGGHALLFPDLMFEHRGTRWLIEVLGFATRDSLASKLARYRAAGFAAVLCADLTLAPGCDLVPQVCGFIGEVDVDDLLATIAAAEAAR